MKALKLLVSVMMLALLTNNVLANTYKNGSVLQDELEYIEVPDDSSYIKWTLPQGEYPEGAKAVLYAQKDVFCFVPGLEYKEPTADANPYVKAAEYTFTSDDIKTLSEKSLTVQTDLLFDIMCGSIKVQIVGGNEKTNNNLVEENREQGSEVSSNGTKLNVYHDGDSFNSKVSYTNGNLVFLIPQGSYTLGDYIVVTQDSRVLDNIIIKKEMMDILVNANVEYAISVDLENTDNLRFLVSSYQFDMGEEVEVPEATGSDVEEVIDLPGEDEGGLNPIIFGVLTFVVVLGGGLLVMFLKNKKEQKTNEPKQIEDNRIVEVEVVDKEEK